VTNSRLLHITNGSAIIDVMREVGVAGPIVPWDDVLHEGPVPTGLGIAALRERRAGFLAACSWGPAEAIARSLAGRDAALDDLARVDEITLWFEHDLYDQLQLLQILDRLPLDGSPQLTAVPDDEFLGLLPTERFAGLFAARREISSAERLAARDAWTAFRSPDPRDVLAVLPRVSVLRHLEPALMRHLQQFPSVANGLSRTEQQALEAIATGTHVAGEIYVAANHHREEAVFMADEPFLAHFGALLRGPVPLIATVRGASTLALDDVVSLTEDGRRVLDARADRVRLCGIDRWLGGVYLSGTGPVWRWDAERSAIRLI
jgi:hypothetical protein